MLVNWSKLSFKDTGLCLCRVSSLFPLTFFSPVLRYTGGVAAKVPRSAERQSESSLRSLNNRMNGNNVPTGKAGDRSSNDKRMVVIDVDTGLDDALAILMLLAADAERLIQLKGITCVAGNTTLNNVCVNTLRLLRATNRLDVPVFAGAVTPIINNLPDSPYHGADGFGDLNLTNSPSLSLMQKENAVNALHRICTESKGKVDLICVGPLSNVALAMRTYPDFNESVRSIHIMGGNNKGVGNISSSAEFNFYTDPEAAHIVLEDSFCPVQIVPWETCYENPMDVEWRSNILGAVGGEVMQLLNKAEHKIDKRWVTCDPLSVAFYLKPSLVRKSTVWHASVELAGMRTRGQMVLDHLRERTKQNVTVVETFCLEDFQQFLLWCADRWTKSSL